MREADSFLYNRFVCKLSTLRLSILRMGDRAVYCARLESVCAERHRGFESPPIRGCSLDLSFALFDDLQLLSQFDHAAVRENPAKIYAGINHAIAADDRTGVDHCVATNFRVIANDCAEFPEACRNVAIGCYDRDFAVIQLYV